MSSVAIILVNWNGWRDTIDCIESCLALEGAEIRIVVCDNSSEDGSVEKIKDWASGHDPHWRDPESPVFLARPRLPRGVVTIDVADAEYDTSENGAELVIIRTGENLGFAGGNNVGLKWAFARNFTHAWLLNNDTVVPKNALAAMLNAMAADTMIGMCGSLVVEYNAPNVLQAFAGAIDLRTFRGRPLAEGLPLTSVTNLKTLQAKCPLRRWDLLYPIGASILVSRDFVNAVGLMEESYFLYYEEADWVLRCAGLYSFTIAVDSRIFHKRGASIGSTTGKNSVRAISFLFRSRLLIAHRFYPFRLPVVIAQIVAESVLALFRGRPAKLHAAMLALTGRIRIPRR
jgi:GT2 family glycosyltransferase